MYRGYGVRGYRPWGLLAMGAQGVWGTWVIGHRGYGVQGLWVTWAMGYMGNGTHGRFAPKISKRCQDVKKMSSSQKDVKCQIVKHLDYGGGSQKKINRHNEVHTY